jgi:hypothetical protein
MEDGMTPYFVRHRINTVRELREVDIAHGVEIDLRSDACAKGSLHLSHDPWRVGEDFGAWLKEYANRGHEGPLLVNTKEDLLEDRVLEYLSEYRVTRFFFIDTAVPTLVRRCFLQGERHFSVRFSKYEGEGFVEPFVGKSEWVWVDCFYGSPVAISAVEWLASKFKVCLASPELHGGGLDSIAAFRPLARFANAVCTKHPERWASHPPNFD